MARPRRVVVDPKDAKSLAEQLDEAVRVLDGQVSFGDPQDPTNPASTTLAGAATGNHPGNIQNIEGAWASATVTAANTAVTFHHNLNLAAPLSVAGRPNVRVLAFWYEHDGWDGAAVDSATDVSTVSYNFQTGDTVAATSVQLRFYAALPRVISVAHPLRVDMFFVPAVSR